MGGIDVIDPRYRVLFDRAVQVLGDDHRVRAVAAGGSVGAGTADRWSDLDLIVVTEPDHHDEFIGDWPGWLGRITPTVFARTPCSGSASLTGRPASPGSRPPASEANSG
jgi:hypothetical protein